MNETNTNRGFTDIFYQQGSVPVICYRTGLTVYEEQFSGGNLTSAGWNCSGYPLNNMQYQPTRLQAGSFSIPYSFRVDVNGQSLEGLWRFVSFRSEKFDGGTNGYLCLKSCIFDVSVIVHTRLDGTSVLTRWLEIKNEGSSDAAINEIAPMSGGIEETQHLDEVFPQRKPCELYTLGYMEDSHACMEGGFKWHDLPSGGHSIYGRYHRGRHRHPMFILKNNHNGTTMIGQFGWTAGYEMFFDHDAERWETDAQNSYLSYSIKLDGPRPHIVLSPGESYITPEVHIGMVNGDHDDAVNAMHEHIRKSVFTYRPAFDRECWLETGLGPELIMDMKATIHFVDYASSIGSEVFMIDAGWTTPPGDERGWGVTMGDWYYNKERYPEGIDLIRDYTHSKGMKFGLWMEAEKMHPSSKVGSAHPDWFCKFASGAGVPSPIIDMTIPEAAEWVENQISRVITDYKLDLFRLDYGGDNKSVFYSKEKGGYMECQAQRHYTAIYRMYDRLRRRFPDVIFENCAGGGGRTDLGLMRYFNHTWVADWQRAPRSFYILNGMTIALPPEKVDRLLAGQRGHRYASLDFQARVTMMARPSMNALNPSDAVTNPEQLAFVKHCADVYKNFIATFQSNSRIYHHTPTKEDVEKTGFGIIETVADDKTKAVIGVFRLNTPLAKDSITVMPKGISNEVQYRLTFDNSGESTLVSGYELKNKGIAVKLSAPLTSELLLLEKNG